MVNFIPVALPFLFLQFTSVCRADEDLFCCNGWSDAVADMMVSKHKGTANCKAVKSCQDSKCAIQYGSIFNKVGASAMDEDCFKPKLGESESCMCKTNWCNCPEALRGQQPKPKPPGLTCCVKTLIDEPWLMTEEICGDTLPQPAGCIARGKSPTFEVGCGLGDRFPGNCTTFIKEELDSLQGICYCQTNLCNCPQKLPKTTTRAATQTPSSFQLGTHQVETPLLFTSFLLSNFK